MPLTHTPRGNGRFALDALASAAPPTARRNFFGTAQNIRIDDGTGLNCATPEHAIDTGGGGILNSAAKARTDYKQIGAGAKAFGHAMRDDLPGSAPMAAELLDVTDDMALACIAKKASCIDKANRVLAKSTATGRGAG